MERKTRKTIKCDICGRELKNEYVYNIHRQACAAKFCDSCEEQEEKTYDIAKKEVNDYSAVKDSKAAVENVDRQIVLNKVYDFFDKLKGYYPSAATEWNKMFQWYSALIPRNPGSASCLGCRRNVYNALKSFYDEKKNGKK